jgi:hypothetical protein
MKTLSIWLPTYGRPHKLAEVAKNIEKATKNSFVLYFGVEPGDSGSIEAAKATGHKVVVNNGDMGYSNTIQACYEASNEPFWFHANDDFYFLENWDEILLTLFEREDLMVVGVPQNEADKTYSAICFARRKYIDEMSGVIDMPKRVFYPYGHNYIDTEFTRTAQARGVWASSSAPCINHLHPGFIGGEKDATYRKNDASAGDDEKTFDSREHLWKNL